MNHLTVFDESRTVFLGIRLITFVIRVAPSPVQAQTFVLYPADPLAGKGSPYLLVTLAVIKVDFEILICF